MSDEIRNLPIQTRAVSPAILDEESRRVRMVFSTGARRTTWSWDDGEIEEELSLDPAHVRLGRLKAGAPILDSHRRGSLDDQVGVTEDAGLSQGEGWAVGRFATGDDRANRVWNKVKQGIAKNLSVGYKVHRYEITKTPGQRPLYRAVDWEPVEISPVSVPADAGAQIRAPEPLTPCVFVTRAESPKPKESPMDHPETTTPVERAQAPAPAPTPTPAPVAEVTPARGDAMRRLAAALGADDDADLDTLARAAENQARLLTATEAEVERLRQGDDVFARNEAAGLHRELERVSKGFAKELYETNRKLYEKKVAKVKPLTGQAPPAAAPEGRRDIASHADDAEAFEREVKEEYERRRAADPKADDAATYKAAFRAVQQRHYPDQQSPRLVRG